jgi:hypothetical protein
VRHETQACQVQQKVAIIPAGNQPVPDQAKGGDRFRRCAGFESYWQLTVYPACGDRVVARVKVVVCNAGKPLTRGARPVVMAISARETAYGE